jgi:hypothetical protein
MVCFSRGFLKTKTAKGECRMAAGPTGLTRRKFYLDHFSLSPGFQIRTPPICRASSSDGRTVPNALIETEIKCIFLRSGRRQKTWRNRGVREIAHSVTWSGGYDLVDDAERTARWESLRPAENINLQLTGPWLMGRSGGCAAFAVLMEPHSLAIVTPTLLARAKLQGRC